MDQSATFEEIWAQYGRPEDTSPELEPLVRELYESLVALRFDADRTRASTERLLTFLASPRGRTDGNCTAVDHFLKLGDFERPELPSPLRDVLTDMASALHDTVSSPETAADFESTPERLLARLRSPA